MMSDEDLLKLVDEDSSSDYREDVGEFGGYVSYSVQGDVLTVKAQAYTDEYGNMEITEKSWRLVPVSQGEPGMYDVKIHQEGVGELVVTEVDVEDCADPDTIRLVVYVVKPGS